MISRNSVYFGFFLFVFAAVAIVIVLFKQQRPQADKFVGIQNFEQCVREGYTVLESYPRQCSLPNGKFFIEVLTAQECKSLEDCPVGQACIGHICKKLTP